jgi:hypothetical protein
MDLKEKLQSLSERAEKLVEQIKTEEGTKQSLILPFFQMLGYDVFNPLEFCPEFDADYGIKKGEKVDYAILIDGTPIILVEAKSCNDKLDKHGSQLFRYYTTTAAKFGVLTNGIKYRFFTDLEQSNKMDEKPFFEIDLFDLKDSAVEYLKRFERDKLDVDSIVSSASELKYSNLLKDFLKKQLSNPSESFTSYIVGEIYDGRKTAAVIDKFTPIVKKSFNQFINETLSNKFKETLKGTEQIKSEENETMLDESSEEINKIITTAEELESYAIIKSILRPVLDLSNITYKDTESYFGILFENNSWKWVCRLYLGSRKSLVLPTEDKKKIKYNLESIDDLFNYSEQIIEVVKRYI